MTQALVLPRSATSATAPLMSEPSRQMSVVSDSSAG
uniref:Uncharacterized protein n=1 Tax=Arundo donax TaxID=35708 RepID=A0A0A9BYY3_ARUDO